LKKTPNTALKKTGGTARPKNQPVVAERPGSWHLARTETERRLSDFEFGLERLAQAYYRWKAACLAAVCDVPLTGDDVAVLNVVRMGDEPKRLSEIGQLLNRVDVPNLPRFNRAEFCRQNDLDPLRPIVGLLPGSRHKELVRILPPMLEALDGWAAKSETTSIHLDLISSLYAQAAQVAITRRHQP